jgi:alkanesulfonate monooxygenase SsuD/methylene tetrahydromethanopterin reductase-like flavin-dependent oxidoreductase (luciferase family)
MSNGRVRIGLGVSRPRVVERWHGAKFDRPLRRMREVVEILRLALPASA